MVRRAALLDQSMFPACKSSNNRDKSLRRAAILVGVGERKTGGRVRVSDCKIDSNSASCTSDKKIQGVCVT
ncbi:hypothetical protein [Bacillus cereus]